MTRRWWCLAVAAAAGCRRDNAPMDVFPEAAPGGWRRVSLREIAASDTPDPVPRTAVQRAQEAVYQAAGGAELDARAYRLSSDAVGLEIAQRWRPSADTVFFNRGKYFVVVKWQQAERQALQAFVKDVNARLAPK